jgi:hypothetical protein
MRAAGAEVQPKEWNDMSGRSWMAALTLAAGMLSLAAARADDTPAPPSGREAAPTATSREPAPTSTQAAGSKVLLELAIAGLSSRGCDVDVKPAHAACVFTPITKHVGSTGKITIEVKNIRTESADRDCSFAITIREPGQAPRTTYRGLRLNPPGSTPPQSLSCYLSSPSRVARMIDEETRKR